MSSRPRQDAIMGGWLPTRQQETLLRAALLPPVQAEADWLAWCRQVDFEDDFIDQGSFRLLPMVYRNLAQQNPSLPEMSRLAGIYRQSWYQNQLISRSCTTLLKQFEEVGIDSLLLKGVPLSQIYYHDMGARPMGDADLLIPSDQLDDAVNLLLDKGWVSSLYDGALVKDFFDINHALGFKHQQKIEVDIHARVFSTNYSDALTDDIWRRAVPLVYHGIQAKTLSPEFHLIHVCAHGFVWNNVPPIRWVADAIRILSRSIVNWELLVESAVDHDLHGNIVDHLNYLKTTWKQPVPDSVVAQLRQAPSSRAMKKLLLSISRPPRSPLDVGPREWAHYCSYSISTGRTNLFSRLLHFPKYMLIRRGLSGYRKLLMWGFGRLTARTSEYFKRLPGKIGAS